MGIVRKSLSAAHPRQEQNAMGWSTTTLAQAQILPVAASCILYGDVAPSLDRFTAYHFVGTSLKETYLKIQNHHVGTRRAEIENEAIDYRRVQNMCRLAGFEFATKNR